MPRRSLLAVLGLLAACGSQSGGANALGRESGAYLTLVEAPPYPPFDRLTPEPVEQTLETRRWLHAERVEARELPLLRRIKREAIGNFGGLEWRWQDGPDNGGLGRLTGILYFLRAPEETLARYTRSPLFQPAQGDFARSDQETIARQWAETIGRDVASEEFGNMRAPTLRLALPRAEFEQRARAEGWRLPRNLMLRLDLRAEPDLPAVSPDLAPLIRAFPQAPRLGGPTPDIATYDAVVLRDGCFFIDEPGENDPLVEFPLGVGVHRDAEGQVAFRPRYSGDRRRLGRVGTRLQLGSRSARRPAPAEIARACNAQEVVAVTSVDQALGYGSSWFGVREYRDRERLSTAEAIRRANACMLAQERSIADRRLREGREQPAQCAAIGLTTHPVPPPPPPPTPPERS